MLSPADQSNKLSRVDDLRGVLTPHGSGGRSNSIAAYHSQYVDALRGVLTPCGSGDRGLSKLSLKYRDQKRSLTPVPKMSLCGISNKSSGKDNFYPSENCSFAEELSGKTSVLFGDKTLSLKQNFDPQGENVPPTMNCVGFVLNAELSQRGTLKHSSPSFQNNSGLQSPTFTIQESPGILNEAINTTPSPIIDSEEELNASCRNGVIILSDSDDCDANEVDSRLRCITSTSSVSSESRNEAFLCTPSMCGSHSVRFGSSTASVSSSRKHQILRSILNSSSSSVEDVLPSPRPLIERISLPVSNLFLRPCSTQETWSRRETPSTDYASQDDSDEDEVFEQFLEKCKTPAKSPYTCLKQKFDPFIISDDNSSSDEDDDLFYLRINNSLSVGDIPTKPSYVNSASNAENKARARSVAEQSITATPGRPKLGSFQPPASLDLTRSLPRSLHHSAGLNEKPRLSFLASLSLQANFALLDCRAACYIKDFKRRKTELVADLYTMYNEKVFEKKLPEDMQITWNPRLTATAGYCYTKKDLKGTRIARLELSTKVLDSAERVRDTLIHELCHAATWLINGVRDGHGRYWKYWARLAQIKFPELPPVSRCHTYHVNTKYTYQCKVCRYSIGRHSKSLDVNKKVCGKCHGQFELIVNSTPSKTPKTPGKFALFVKENYGQVKKSNRLNSHGDVMKSLSEEFAAKNKIL